MTCLLHPEADEEFAEGVRYYSEISPSLGARFYREIERLLCEVASEPERFRMFDPPVRRHFGRDFPYAVLFINRADFVWVVAVMHMKRCPGYWRERIS